jgi:DNA-binding MarR family transcriptional regulator
VTALYEEVLAEKGIRVTQYTSLQMVKRVPNLTTTELADAIGIDQTTATRTLALLKKGSLVTSTLGDDRREKRWMLTSAGESTLRKLKPAWEAAQAAFERRLGPTQAHALREAAYLAARKLDTSGVVS